VGLPSAAPVSKESEAHSSPRPLSRRIAEFRHVGAATLILIGILALASGEFLGGEGAAVMSVVGVLGYLLERITRYYSLPALLHQRELHSQLTQLHRDLDEQTVKKRAVEQQMLTLTQQEHQEKVQELRRRQDAHGSAYLSSIPISRLKDISGIGPYVLDNLQNAGIHNALQLKQRGAYNVQGVGTKRRGQILAMLSQWERAGSHNSPRALPLDVEARIASKYQAQRQVLGNQFGEMGRRIAAIGSDKSEAEWQLKQLHVPTFSQFLKNTL